MSSDQTPAVHEGARVPVTMSAAVLKALSNPLRRRIVNALSVARSGRAADLSERLGVPANKLSFHLRVLADAGLIREDPSLARDRRDRVWVSVRGPRTIGSPEHPMEDAALGQAVLAGLVSDHTDVLRRIAEWATSFTTGEDPVVRGALTDATLRLRRSDFEAMTEEIDAVVAKYKRLDSDPEPGVGPAAQDEGGAADEGAEPVLGWNLVVMAASEEI